MSIFFLHTVPPGALGSESSPQLQSLIELWDMMAASLSEISSTSAHALYIIVALNHAIVYDSGSPRYSNSGAARVV